MFSYFITCIKKNNVFPIESSDYNITACNNTIELGLASESSNVSITLNSDTVALERTEVLRLELELMSPNQTYSDCSPNIFFVDEATIEIIDTTGTFILYCLGADLGNLCVCVCRRLGVCMSEVCDKGEGVV